MNNQVSLQVVKVENPRRHSKTTESEKQRIKKKSSNRNSEFVYVNNAYVGSLNSVNEVRIQAPPTSVVREQYWACSKWPLAQRILAVSVGILVGAVIGLAVTLVLGAVTSNGEISTIFGSSAPD